MDRLKIQNKDVKVRHNVTINVLDADTMKIVSHHTGHNAATNSLLTGIGHYLTGDGVLNQGYPMLSQFVPRYISLGTMGLINQDADSSGLPASIGVDTQTTATPEAERFTEYMHQVPGFGADGYDEFENNGRKYFGLGPMFSSAHPNNCELISASFPRAEISYRDIVPETEAELPKTIDIVFSAMISTGALSQFRGKDKDYVFITEAGLWSEPDWNDSGANGLLAGYRISPPNKVNWDMSIPENRDILKRQIIRVGINQVVQVIWKIQLGDFSSDYTPPIDPKEIRDGSITNPFVEKLDLEIRVSEVSIV